MTGTVELTFEDVVRAGRVLFGPAFAAESGAWRDTLKATYRRPARSDMDLSKLPGGMPDLSSLKLAPYNEEAWTAKRKETLEKIRDLIQETR